MIQERDYSQMSPQELNAEMKRIWGQLPCCFDYQSGVEAHLERMEKREVSNHKTILFQRLKKLIAYSPQITSSFADYIVDTFNIYYSLGVEEDKPKPGNFYLFIDPEFPDSDGIFDPARAKKIERIAYWWRLSFQLKAYFEGIGDSVSVEKLAKWRQEFIVQNGDEP